MKTEIGERVIALMAVEGKIVRSFGEGVYLGPQVPDASLPGMAGVMGQHHIPNPAIKLDSGEMVYGCECWWGPVDKVKEKYADHGWREESITKEREALPGEKPAQTKQEPPDMAGDTIQSL